MSWQLKVGVFTIVLAVIGGGGAIMIRNFLSPNDDGPLYSEERNRYIALEFYPKYNTADCTISFDLHLNKPVVQFAVLLQDTFQRYISYHEPRVGAMMVDYLAIRRSDQAPGQKDVAPFEIKFSNQCDRKDEIFDAMVAYAKKRYGTSFSIERLPHTQPELTPSRLWLDSPDYDPTYWPTYHKAMLGDGEAFAVLAQFEAQNDLSRQHLFYALAEHYLLNGPMRERVHQKKDAAWQKMKPEQQERQGLIIEDWKLKIKKYTSQ